MPHLLPTLPSSPYTAPNMQGALRELYRRSPNNLPKAGKTLRELFPDVTATRGNLGLCPRELVEGPSRATPGAVCFVRDHAQLPEALSRGALAIVSEKPLPTDLPAVALQVPSLPHALADAARRMWGMPERKLTLTALAGSHGKSSTAYVLRHVLHEAGQEPGMITNLETDLGGHCVPATDPHIGPLEWTSYLAQMARNGVRQAIMETCPEGLEGGRFLGLGFEVALFTGVENSNPHQAQAQYLAWKKLFDGSSLPRPKVAVINLDNAYGQRLMSEIDEKVEVITYGHLGACDVRLTAEECRWGHSELTLLLGHRRYQAHTRLTGHGHAMNVAAALTVGYALGVNLKAATAALVGLEKIPGRMQYLGHSDGVQVVADSASHADALRNSLLGLRKLTAGRVITVWGAKGRMSTMERALAGRTATELSDLVIATTDDPAGHNLRQLWQDMTHGLKEKKEKEKFKLTLDRRKAVEEALKAARPGDCVVLAGKGHETTQALADAIIPFDDRLVAKEIARELGRPLRHD